MIDRAYEAYLFNMQEPDAPSNTASQHLTTSKAQSIAEGRKAINAANEAAKLHITTSSNTPLINEEVS